MTHTHQYFSEIHASKESQWFGMEDSTPDTAEIIELREKLAANPNQIPLMIELADQLGHHLRYREAIALYSLVLEKEPSHYEARRKRAPRYFSTLQLGEALADYAQCARERPDSGEVQYRLGITAYAMRDGDQARACFSKCLDLFADDPEMLVASAYWLTLTSAREKMESGYAFNFGLEISHHVGYRDGLGAFCGEFSSEEIHRKWSQNEDTLNGGIALYALVYCYARKGDMTRAGEILEELLAADEFWAGFAYIAAWTDRGRLCLL